MGDSFSFGSGVEVWESYPRVLERLLNKKMSGKKWEVINAGVCGYGTFHEQSNLSHDPEKPSEQVSILDLLRLLKDHSSPDSLYLPTNGHWSAEGHAIAAKLILEKLLTEGFVYTNYLEFTSAPFNIL